MFLVYHRGEVLCALLDAETAEKYARLCASEGAKVRVVEYGKQRGKQYAAKPEKETP